LKLFFEQVTVGAAPLKIKRIFILPVDEQPVWLNVTISRPYSGTSQCVVTMFRIKHLSVRNLPDDFFQLLNILASFFYFFEVFPELTGLKNGFHLSQLSKSFSTLSNDVRLIPFSESSRAFRVVAFGIATSNGSPRFKVICV